MRKYLWTLSAIFTLAISSCQEKTTLSDDQKRVIISEVKDVFELSGKGIEERNADKAFSIFSTKEGTKYIRDGHLYPSIDTAKNQYAKWFSYPGPKQKITFDPMIFDLLDKNIVLVTTIGYFENVEKTSPDEKPWILAYTMLFRKEPEGWKLFHMHNSWP
jgi:SnoaL-like domain